MKTLTYDHCRWRAANLDLYLVLMRGSLTCHTYCDKGHPFKKSSPKFRNIHICCRAFVCLFVCLGVIVPLEIFSLIWRHYHCWWRAANFDLCSAQLERVQLGSCTWVSKIIHVQMSERFILSIAHLLYLIHILMKISLKTSFAFLSSRLVRSREFRATDTTMTSTLVQSIEKKSIIDTG